MFWGFVLMGMVPIAAVCLAVYFIFYLVKKKTEGKQPFLRHLTRYAFLGCVCCLVFLTLLWGGYSFDAGYHLLNLRPFVWVTQTYTMGGEKMLMQLVTNIIMFMPYGVLLPLVFNRLRRWWKTDLIVFASSLVIEVVQYFIGRSCDVDDLIMNTLGGCIGFGLFCLAHRFFKEKQWYKQMAGVK